MIAVSVDGPEDTKLTQAQVPHLLVLTDESRGLSNAAEMLDAKNKGPNGSVINAPTTILVDRQGKVRWVYRPVEIITRLSPDEVLQAMADHMPAQP